MSLVGGGQGEFKNRRKSRSRRGNEGEVFFAQKSASSRCPFLNTTLGGGLSVAGRLRSNIGGPQSMSVAADHH